MREIDRPLGQQPMPGAGRKPGTLRRGLLIGVPAALVFAASAAISLRPSPFRTPAPMAVTAPVPPAEKTAEAVPPAAKPGSTGQGPQIIHVPPDAAGKIVIRDPSALGQDLRVAHLPDRDLIEQTETGPLPMRSADGRRPMDVYARPWSGARGARVALVIGGMGVSQTSTQAAIARLPPEVTLGFASNGNSLGRWMQEARHRGFEIVMQVPLEPFDYPGVNPGRKTLTVSASPEKNIESLHWALSRTTNYTGIMNYMGARFTSDAAAMEPLMSELSQRGLLYFDDGTSARSLAPELARKDGVAIATGDAVIDETREPGAILKKLDELERIARAKGFAVGSGSAFAETVDAVTRWVEEARKRGIEIVPVSAVVTDPERGG